MNGLPNKAVESLTVTFLVYIKGSATRGNGISNRGGTGPPCGTTITFFFLNWFSISRTVLDNKKAGIAYFIGLSGFYWIASDY